MTQKIHKKHSFGGSHCLLPNFALQCYNREEREGHPLRKIGFAPIVDERSRVLVLGTFPSLLSRREEWYYAHPRNAFWPILFRIYGRAFDRPGLEEKRGLLLENGVALWDVVASCETEGSADTEIKSPVLIDLTGFLREHAGIKRVCYNGGNAARFAKGLGPLPVPGLTLPSTSPANARYHFDAKLEIWRNAILKEESV